MNTFDSDPSSQPHLDSPSSGLDAATSARLHRLSGMPVDLAALERRIARDIPKPQTRRAFWPISLRPVHAVAASLLAGVLTVGLVISLSAPPVEASPQVLAGLYHDSSMSGTVGHADMPVMACCIQKVKGKPVTCVMLDSNGSRVSMMIAEAKDFRVPSEAMRRESDSGPYYFQSSASLNMVMAVRDKTWVCLMGPVPEAELVKMLAKAPSTSK